MHTLAKRTYVNSDSTKVVDEGSADAAYLLGNEGDEISDETATRLGLGTAIPTKAAYGDMKVADLRSLAKERGVEIDSDAKKADVIDALEEADKAAPAATATAEAEGEGGTADVSGASTADASSPADV